MAPKKSKKSRPSPIAPITNIVNLIRDCNIPNSIQIRHITMDEKKRWKDEGLDKCLLILGKKHIETIHLPIHPMIQQFLSALQVHPMQLTPNSLKFIVASIILNEVEGKDSTVNDLLYAFRVSKTLTNPNAPPENTTLFISPPMTTFQRKSSCSLEN